MHSVSFKSANVNVYLFAGVKQQMGGVRRPPQKFLRGSLSINALRTCVYIGGHFRIVFSCFVRFLVKNKSA